MGGSHGGPSGFWGLARAGSPSERASCLRSDPPGVCRRPVFHDWHPQRVNVSGSTFSFDGLRLKSLTWRPRWEPRNCVSPQLQQSCFYSLVPALGQARQCLRSDRRFHDRGEQRPCRSGDPQLPPAERPSGRLPQRRGPGALPSAGRHHRDRRRRLGIGHSRFHRPQVDPGPARAL